MEGGTDDVGDGLPGENVTSHELCLPGRKCRTSATPPIDIFGGESERTMTFSPSVVFVIAAIICKKAKGPSVGGVQKGKIGKRRATHADWDQKYDGHQYCEVESPDGKLEGPPDHQSCCSREVRAEHREVVATRSGELANRRRREEMQEGNGRSWDSWVGPFEHCTVGISKYRFFAMKDKREQGETDSRREYLRRRPGSQTHS